MSQRVCGGGAAYTACQLGGAAGELIAVKSGTDLKIMADVDGDARTDMVIVLSNISSMTEADFLL